MSEPAKSEEIPQSLFVQALQGQAQPRPVAVVGSAPATRHKTPGNDDKQFAVPSPHVLGGHGKVFLPENEVWAVGTVDQLDRWDVFFDLHDPATYGPEYKTYMKWLGEQVKPIVCSPPMAPFVRNAVIYPREKMERKYGTYFFTSSVAWMMALAIEMKVPKIGVYGIDMADTVEYRAQKSGCKHFATIARLFGIQVDVPPGSDLLFEPEPYPFVLEDPLMMKINARERELGAFGQHHKNRITELNGHIQAVQQQIGHHQMAVYKIEGGIEYGQLMKKNWTWEGWPGTSPSGLPHMSVLFEEAKKFAAQQPPLPQMPITQPKA